MCLTENGPIALKPTNITYEEATAIPIGALTIFHYLKKKGDAKSEQKVLIYGASGSVRTYNNLTPDGNAISLKTNMTIIKF